MKRLIILLILLFPSFAWASGTTTFSTCVARFDLTATNGFLYDECRDLSPWESGTTKARIIVTDSAGKIARGRVGNAGSGVTTMGAEILTNGGFENWTGGNPDNWGESANAHATESAGNGGGSCVEITHTGGVGSEGLYQNSATYNPKEAYVAKFDFSNTAGAAGLLRFIVYTANAPAGNFIIDTLTSSVTPTWTSQTRYFTTPSHAETASIRFYTFGSFAYYDNATVKRILTPGATGVYVVWDSIDASFDYNDSSGYTVKLRAASDDDGPRSRSGRMRRGR